MEVLCAGTEKGEVEVYSVEVGQDSDADDDDDDEDSDKEPKGSAQVDRVGTLVGHSNRYVLSSLAPPHVYSTDKAESNPSPYSPSSRPPAPQSS
jgi:hypothetical protein